MTTMFLFGFAGGLGLAVLVVRLGESGPGRSARVACQYRWVARRSRVREVRRTTRRAVAHAATQSERPAAVDPDDGSHRAGDRATRPAPVPGVYAS